MELQIKTNAAQYYSMGVPRFGTINWVWYTTMEIISGHRLMVETKHLFRDQYNTAPVDAEMVDVWIAEYHGHLGDYMYNIRKDAEIAKARESLITTGLRVMDNVVEYIVDDERAGKMRCNWCGCVSDKGAFCAKCGKKEYLETFDNAYFVKYPNGKPKMVGSV